MSTPHSSPAQRAADSAQHTPGPLCFGDTIRNLEGQGFNQFRTAIYTDGMQTFVMYATGRTYAESEANARLIVAAPDLLAVLKRVQEIITSGEDLSNETFFATEQNWIRATITRATSAP